MQPQLYISLLLQYPREASIVKNRRRNNRANKNKMRRGGTVREKYCSSSVGDA